MCRCACARSYVCGREIRAETYSLRQSIAARAQSNLLRCDFPSVFLVHRVRHAKHVGSVNTIVRDYRFPRHEFTATTGPTARRSSGHVLRFQSGSAVNILCAEDRIELDSIPIPFSFIDVRRWSTEARHAVLDLQTI